MPRESNHQAREKILFFRYFGVQEEWIKIIDPELQCPKTKKGRRRIEFQFKNNNKPAKFSYPRFTKSPEFDSRAGIMIRSNKFRCGNREESLAGIVRQSSMAVCWSIIESFDNAIIR